ncbi:MAG: hypothetical protein AAF628_09830 [Planctomycetota bacterium]
MTRRTRWCLCAFFCLAPATAAQDEAPRFAVAGLVLPSAAPAADAALYTALGFEPVRQADAAQLLRLGDLLLVLDGGRPCPRAPAVAPLHFNLRVPDLEQAARTVEQHGGQRLDPTPIAFVLGHAVRVRDASGNFFELVDLAQRPVDAPRLFNLSLHKAGMASLRALFVDQLGFAVFSDDYLPRTLPLHQRGAAPLVLHDDTHADRPVPPATAPGRGAALLLAAKDALAALGACDDLRAEAPVPSVWFGAVLVVRAEGGVELRLASQDAVHQAVPGPGVGGATGG